MELKMLYMTFLLAMAGLAASEVDEEVNAKFVTMQRSNFIEYFNERNFTWKTKQYSTEFFSNFKPNPLYNIFDNKNVLPQRSYHPLNIKLPENFDSRVKWSRCRTIGEIYNQYNCDSCWAHGVANTASDRTCIHRGIYVELSEQDLECSHPFENICHTGCPANGFKFWRDSGLVTRQCKPYNPLDLNRYGCVRFCSYSPFKEHYLNDKHKAKEVYSLPKNSYQIKAELFLNGPIQAGMNIYDDFIPNINTGSYSSGIYEHKYGQNIKFFHSVRVIGYGVENGIEYWLAANTWGNTWGENGFFRIKSFQSEIGFEDHMITGIPLY